MKRLFALVLSVLFVTSAYAATVPTTGLVFIANCASIANPVTNQTACFQTTTTGGRTAGQIYVWNGASYTQISGSGGAAPTDATYITQTANGTLTNEQNLAALSTGILKSTQATGVVSIAGSGTDYAPATSGTSILKGSGSGGFSNASAGTDYAAAPTGSANTPLFNNGSGGFTNGTRTGNTTAVVTATGTLTSGDCAQWDANGNAVASGGPCASGSGITQLTGNVTAGPGSGSQAATIANGVVSLAKIANAAANDKLLGSGNSGSGASYAEITLGSGLTMTGTTLSAAGGSSGLTLVEKKTITSNSTTTTFSSLDGDTDGVYLLQGRVFNSAASTCNVTLQPNSVSSNQTSAFLYWDTTTPGTLNSSDWRVANITNAKQGSFVVTIYAKKNPNSQAAQRYFTGTFVSDFGGIANAFVGGRWNETSTNITSLVVVGDQTNCLGNGSELTLYKYAQS
mgnify:FL=1